MTGKARANPGREFSQKAGLYAFPSGRPPGYRDFSASRREARSWFFGRTLRERERLRGLRHEVAFPSSFGGPEHPTPPSMEGPIEIPLERPLVEEMIPESPAPEFPEPPPLPETSPSPEPAAPAPPIRWQALRELLGDADHGSSREPSAPVILLFSIAGGVGKSTIAANLARALSARGERVLLADAVSPGFLTLAFGSRDPKPGVVRTFVPSGTSADAPIQTIALDVTAPIQPDFILDVIQRHAGQASRIIVDLPTNGKTLARGLLPLASVVLAPLLPDANSAATLSTMEEFFSSPGSRNAPCRFFYVLNQFDPGLSLHEFERAALAARLSPQLLSSPLHRDSRVSEALAEGMTVLDFAPASVAAHDYRKLAAWLRSISPPADGLDSRRWTEVPQ